MKRAFLLLLAGIISTQVLAMAKTTKPYEPPQWHENANAEDDAGVALKYDDKRLLAYYGRGVVIPGIQPDEKEILSEKCGLRMMDGFGDVVRSDAHLEKMKIMRAYAEKYNQLVAPQCRKDKD
jgi:hypothetical protein